MDYDEIDYEVEDHILTITLDRPDQLNAFTVKMQRQLVDAFDRADADDDVRVIIVTGRGRGFCAGADLSMGAEAFDTGAQAKLVGVSEADAIKASGSSSASARSNASTSWRCIFTVNALSWSGRSSVMVRMWSSTS